MPYNVIRNTGGHMEYSAKKDKLGQGMAAGIAGGAAVGLVFGPPGVIVETIIGGIIGAAVGDEANKKGV